MLILYRIQYIVMMMIIVVGQIQIKIDKFIKLRAYFIFSLSSLLFLLIQRDIR